MPPVEQTLLLKELSSSVIERMLIPVDAQLISIEFPLLGPAGIIITVVIRLLAARGMHVAQSLA